MIKQASTQRQFQRRQMPRPPNRLRALGERRRGEPEQCARLRLRRENNA
jgi:hypothetical protein